MRVPVRDRDVSGFGGGLLELLGRMKAEKEVEAPSPPALAAGEVANEKHTLAGTVFAREFNYPVFRSRCFPFGFGVGFLFQLTETARPFYLTLKDSEG